MNKIYPFSNRCFCYNRNKNAKVLFPSQELVVWKRAAMVGGGGLCAILGAPLAHFPSAGPLACVTMAFVASVCWKTQGSVAGKVSVS